MPVREGDTITVQPDDQWEIQEVEWRQSLRMVKGQLLPYQVHKTPEVRVRFAYILSIPTSLAKSELTTAAGEPETKGVHLGR